MISVCIPYYDMPNGALFLKRAIDSVMSQTYKDYEIVLTKDGRASENTNAGIKRAKGDIIKILHMDDFLAHENALQNIADNFNGGWLVTGCTHTKGEDRFNDHLATWNPHIGTFNTIGAPSVLAFENNDPLFFNEDMVWMFDCEYYARLYERYGKPTILDSIDVVIGIHDDQATNLIPDEIKRKEEYVQRTLQHAV